MTFYNKPHDLKYTDMAIWIDENAYKEDCDEPKMYEYLYHITKMLAYEGRFFKTFAEYEEFALYAATTIFMRYKDEKQHIETSRMKPIVSVLNYAKRVVLPLKFDFVAQYKPSQNSIDDESETNNTPIRDIIMDSVDAFNVSNFNLYLDDIPNTIREFLQHIPYTGVEWVNIYTSCVLSFLNSVTLTNHDLANIESLQRTGHIKSETLEKLYKQTREDAVVLFHLPPSMYDYIKVLTNEIRHLICEDLSQVLHTYVFDNDGGMVAYANKE